MAGCRFKWLSQLDDRNKVNIRHYFIMFYVSHLVQIWNIIFRIHIFLLTTKIIDISLFISIFEQVENYKGVWSMPALMFEVYILWCLKYVCWRVFIVKLNITMLVYLNTEISIIHIFVKYFIRFVVHLLSEDLITCISTTYNLHT